MNLAATSFDLDNARCCAALADAAYGDDTQIIPGALSIKLIQGEQTDTQVLVVEFPEYISVNFCGTKNLKDALTDVKIKRMPIAGGSAHVGFVQAILEAFPKLEAYLATLSTLKPLIITGHSLGGALAALFAYLWELRNRKYKPGALVPQSIAFVYTFGKPRVFGRLAQFSYNAALRSRTFRVVNCGDPVPLLPGLLIGYLHEGQEAFLSDTPVLHKVELRINPSRLWEIFNDSWDLYDDLKDRDWSALLASEHHIEFYRTQLALACAA